MQNLFRFEFYSPVNTYTMLDVVQTSECQHWRGWKLLKAESKIKPALLQMLKVEKCVYQMLEWILEWIRREYVEIFYSET